MGFTLFDSIWQLLILIGFITIVGYIIRIITKNKER